HGVNPAGHRAKVRAGQHFDSMAGCGENRHLVARTKLVGIRLRSYDRYLGDMSPSVAEFASKGLSIMKLLARGASMVLVQGGLGLWMAAQGRSLKSFGKVGTLAESMMWSRENFGFDLGFAWSDMDRSPEAFVALLEQ